MAKNNYIIIRTSLDIPTLDNCPSVIFADIFEYDIPHGNFTSNHIYTNKKSAKAFAAEMTKLFSEAKQISYKVWQIKEAK